MTLDLLSFEVLRPLRNLDALKDGSISGEFVLGGIITSLEGFDIIFIFFIFI